jgi:predicted NACHT family NTPase
MDEGKFAADFIARNLENIYKIARSTFGTLDEVLQVKLKTAYTQYLTKTREKYSKSKSFFIRTESVDLYSYYVPTGIACGNETILAPSFENTIKLSKRIVINGTGGTGKSVLMKHLFLDCIKDKRYAPILIELRDLNSSKLNLNKYIINVLETYKFNISGDFVNRAQKAGHFCFFFDGYDEVNHSLRKKLINEILTISNKFPDCPMFISSRPDDVFNGIDDFNIFTVLPLSLDTAINLIKKLPFDEEIKTKFNHDLSNGLFEKHKSFLSNPLLLSIMLITYGENAEIPSKLSVFYNQAYEALFQRHDANKGGYSRKRLTNLDILDFSRVFSLFALQTYDKRLFKMPRTVCLDYIEKSRNNLEKDFSAEDYLSDLLSAACLLLEDGLEIAFSHRSFQEYFVALHISSVSPEIRGKLIDRYWPKMRSDNVINLLLEINPELVERVLLLPKLEKLFSSIGVKKKVGIMHTARYFKNIYKSLIFNKGRTSAEYKVSEACADDIVHMAVVHCKTYHLPEKSYFESFNNDLYKKYNKEGRQSTRYLTKDLSYKSPVLSDVMKGKGAFSIDYLQAAFEAYKKLKLKHENCSQNLDELLGI